MTIWHWIVTLFIIGIYFLPTMIAYARGHHNALAIMLTNLFLGWTALGWIAALVWSATAARQQAVNVVVQTNPERG
jgi:hypothetical protein